MKPPRFWSGLLDRWLPASEREALLGDLDEVFRERAERDGHRAARRWYAAEARGLLLEFAAESLRDGVNGMTGGWRMGSFRQDVRAALRGMRKRWVVTAWSVVALGLGIGLTTTTFSIVWGSLMRGLPVEESERLVHFERRNAERNELPVSHHDYLDWRERQNSFEALGAYVEAVATLEDSEGVPFRLEGLSADRATFEVLRVTPQSGRLFTDAEQRAGGPEVVLMSDFAWRTHFGADPGIVGRTVRLNGRPTTVVGVMPAGFRFPFSEDIWFPLRLDRGAVPRGSGRLDVIGRLRDGVTFEVAAAEMESIGAALEREFPETNAGIRPAPMSFNREFVGDDFPRIAMGLLIGAVLVLVIACANVASLALVQASGRARELAVRIALGAGRARLFRLLLTESFLLAGAGALLGTVLAVEGVSWFGAAVARTGTLELPHGSVAPYWWEFGVDAGPLLFTVAVVFLVTAVVGLIPGFFAVRPDSTASLKSGERGSGAGARRWSAPLVAVETALSAGVLVASVVMISSMGALTDVDSGVPTEGLVAGRIALPQTDDASIGSHADRVAFWQRLSDEIAVTPGVRRASISTSVPMLIAPFTQVTIEGDGSQDVADLGTRTAMVGPEFFDLYGLDATEGRVIGREDEAGSAPVAVVNESFVTRHLGGTSPIGRRIRLGSEESEDAWLTVVGVVPDFWMDAERDNNPQGVYTALQQAETPDPAARHGRLRLLYGWAVVEVDGGVRAGQEAIQAAVTRIAPGVPVYGTRTLSEIVDSRLRRYRLFGSFYLVFGAVALFLAVMGTYAVTAYAVQTRTSEIGIRMALGAQADRIRGLVIAQGFRAVAVGLVVGVALAIWITGGLARVVYDVDPQNPIAFGAGLGVLAVAALVACAVPAVRATRIDPKQAMRPD